MQATTCLLILTSQADAPPNTVTQINVTATPASHNADTRELQVLSLIVTLAQEASRKKDLQKETRLKVWHIALIAVVSCLLVIVAVVVACRVKRGSFWGKPAESKTKSRPQGITIDHALQLHKINEGFVRDM